MYLSWLSDYRCTCLLFICISCRLVVAWYKKKMLGMLCFSNNVKNIEKYITADMERVKGESRKQNKLQAADSSFIPLYCLSFCSQWIISPLLKFILLRRNISPFLYFPFLSAFPFYRLSVITQLKTQKWRTGCINANLTMSFQYLTLFFVGARIVQMQSTAWSGFTLDSSSTWLERITPSAPDSSNWQSDPETMTVGKKQSESKKEDMWSDGK